MFPQRNRNFGEFCHKEIVENRKIGRVIRKHHLAIFLEFSYYFHILQ